MKLIVGLGNPGQEYKNTRHNIGFIFLDEYFKENKITNLREKFKSEYVQINKNGDKIFFQKPNTFMNLSGEAVSEILKFYKMDAKNDLYVLYDDMDLEFGKIKIRDTGRPAGHNGIKSIIQHCGEKFVRIKFGIGKPRNTGGSISHVLGKFSEEEKEIIKEKTETVLNIFDEIIEGKETLRLMEKYNKKEKKSNKED